MSYVHHMGSTHPFKTNGTRRDWYITNHCKCGAAFPLEVDSTSMPWVCKSCNAPIALYQDPTKVGTLHDISKHFQNRSGSLSVILCDAYWNAFSGQQPNPGVLIIQSPHTGQWLSRFCIGCNWDYKTPVAQGGCGRSPIRRECVKCSYPWPDFPAGADALWYYGTGSYQAQPSALTPAPSEAKMEAPDKPKPPIDFFAINKEFASR